MRVFGRGLALTAALAAGVGGCDRPRSAASGGAPVRPCMVWDAGLAPGDPAAEFAFGPDHIGGVTTRTRFSVEAIARAFPSAKVTLEEVEVPTDYQPAPVVPRIVVRAPGIEITLEKERDGECVVGALLKGDGLHGPLVLDVGTRWRASDFAPADCRTDPSPTLALEVSTMSCTRPGEPALRYRFVIPPQVYSDPIDFDRARFAMCNGAVFKERDTPAR